MDIRMKSLTISLNVAACIILIVIISFHLLRPLDYALYDSQMKRSMSHQPHDSIIVVGIDEQSMNDARLGRFPWDRSVYAEFLEIVNQADHQPDVIAFDISFASPTNVESDATLAKALARYDNVIFPSIANLEGEFSRTTRVKRNELLRARSLEQPFEAFANLTESAHINALIDSDRTIRRAWLQIETPDRGVLDVLALKAVRMAGYEVDEHLQKHPQTEILIDFEAQSFDFMTVSFIDVLNGTFPPQNFQDALVFVGFNAPGLERDNRGTPVETSMMLVYAHANIANQLIQGTYITPTSTLFGASHDGYVVLIAILLIVLTAFVTWRAKTVYGIIYLCLIAAAVYGLQAIGFYQLDIYFSAVYSFAAMIVSYFINIAIKSYVEAKKRSYITAQFGRYISPDLVKEIVSSGREIQLGGINKELTILFLDIRGFTTLSEKLKPEEVVDLLNMMFDVITEAALSNEGTIDKFIGDAAMIIFNAPLDVEEHERLAVKTAIEIRAGMKSVRDSVLEKYGVAIDVGIGIHSGEVVVGNIGSYLRVDYTAIGDNVNIAARIESVAGANQILVSGDTYERTKQFFEYRSIGAKTMKGKSEPIPIYEVM